MSARMTPEAAQELVGILKLSDKKKGRDGSIKKGRGVLRTADGCLCVLGVIAHVNGRLPKSAGQVCSIPEGRHKGFIPRTLGVSFSQQRTLAALNDDFDTFAPVIAKIKELFIDGAES